MIIQFQDYNSANEVIDNYYKKEWSVLKGTIEEMPLYLKASDQKGKQGQPVFDNKGVNRHLKALLKREAWHDTIQLGEDLDFLGTDLDFGKRGLILEVQFSNYPFLLNNIIRSEVLFKSHFQFDDIPVDILLIITKAHLFPAANSTLYYEQAIGQINFLDELEIFDIPVRLIGLFEGYGDRIPIVWSEYTDPRYSRALVKETHMTCNIQQQPDHGLKKRRAKILVDAKKT
jgi:hypothetical protein